MYELPLLFAFFNHLDHHWREARAWVTFAALYEGRYTPEYEELFAMRAAMRRLLPEEIPKLSGHRFRQDFLDPAYRAALRLTRNREDAWDAAITAAGRVINLYYVDQIKKSGSFKKDSRLRAYIVRAAINEAKGLINRRVRREDVECTSTESVLAPSACDAAAEREDNERIDSAILSLPGGLRKVVELRLSGLTYTEIGESLGIPKGTVSTRLRKARVLLAESLQLAEVA